MSHNYEKTHYRCRDEFEGLITDTQEWTCKKCEKKVKTYACYEPDDKTPCVDTREDRYQKQLLLEKVQEKRVQGWGNGNKARKRQ